MNIILTNHSKKRMVERGISIENIKETVEIPDYTISRKTKKEAYKLMNKRLLKVVYLEKDNYIKIITLMWK